MVEYNIDCDGASNNQCLSKKISENIFYYKNNIATELMFIYNVFVLFNFIHIYITGETHEDRLCLHTNKYF